MDLKFPEIGLSTYNKKMNKLNIILNWKLFILPILYHLNKLYSNNIMNYKKKIICSMSIKSQNITF